MSEQSEYLVFTITDQDLVVCRLHVAAAFNALPSANLLHKTAPELLKNNDQCQRQAEHRAKIRENPELYKAYLEKDRKRKGSALTTAKAQMTAKQKEEFLMKECLRLRKLRAAKKTSSKLR